MQRAANAGRRAAGGVGAEGLGQITCFNFAERVTQTRRTESWPAVT